jgi:hypothetical protein
MIDGIMINNETEVIYEKQTPKTER